MPAIPVIMAVGAAAATVGAIGSIYQGRQASKAAAKAAEAEKRRAELENVRAARQAVRQARIAQATVINQGANTGTLNSSGVQGGVASIGSQSAGNLSYMMDIAKENTSIYNATADSARASANANIFGQIGSFGQTIFSMTYQGQPATPKEGS